MTTPHSTRPGQPGQPGTGAATDQETPVPQQPEPGSYGEPRTSYPPGAAGMQPSSLPGLARATWPALLAAALGSLAVGILLLVWPKATLVIAAILIGAGLIIAGILRLIDGFADRDASGGRRAANVVIGLLAVIVGLYFIRHYHITIAAMAIVVGLFWVMHGIADLTVGLFAGPFPGRGLTVFSGLLSLAAGLIVLFWPAISLTILVVVLGIWLVVYGVLLAIMAFGLRKAGSSRPGSDQFAAA